MENDFDKALQRFNTYKNYCKLLNGTTNTYLQTCKELPHIPAQLNEWFKLFDGGLLFTTSMLSTRTKEPGVFNKLSSFVEINQDGYKEQNGLPDDVVCFAITNYGNYYCYISSENSGCIYEWDVEQRALTIKWNSFAEWLNEEIDFAIELINDGVLKPLKNITIDKLRTTK